MNRFISILTSLLSLMFASPRKRDKNMADWNNKEKDKWTRFDTTNVKKFKLFPKITDIKSARHKAENAGIISFFIGLMSGAFALMISFSDDFEGGLEYPIGFSFVSVLFFYVAYKIKILKTYGCVPIIATIVIGNFIATFGIILVGAITLNKFHASVFISLGLPLIFSYFSIHALQGWWAIRKFEKTEPAGEKKRWVKFIDFFLLSAFIVFILLTIIGTFYL